MKTPTGSSSFSSILPFLLKKPRWPQHLGQLANQIGYTPIALEITSSTYLLQQEKILEVFDWLLCKGASPTAHRHGYTSLMLLSRHPYTSLKNSNLEKNIIKIASCLLERGISVDCRFKPENEEDKIYAGRTALLFACESGNIKLLRWLLDNKANPHAQDEKGHTALSLLSHSNNQFSTTLETTLERWTKEIDEVLRPSEEIILKPSLFKPTFKS